MELSEKHVHKLETKEAKLQENLPFQVKMLQLGVETQGKSAFMDKLINVVEYMQLLSQIVFLNSRFTYAKNPGLLYECVLYILKIFNPCFLISSERNRPLLISLFILVISVLIYQALLATSIGLIVWKFDKGDRRLRKLWKWNLKMIGRCTTYFIISFFVNVLEAHPDVTSISKALIISIAVIVGLFQVVSSIALWIRYPYILPNKQFFSAKNKYIEIITLVQKLVLLILQVSLSSSRPNVNNWVVAVINLAFDFARNGYYLKNLPPFQTFTINFTAILSISITSLNVGFLMIALSNSITYNPNNMPYALILGLLFFPIIAKIFLMCIQRRIRLTMSGFNPKSPVSILIHKIELVRQLRQNTHAGNKFNRTIERDYLAQASVDASPGAIFGLDPDYLVQQGAENIEDKLSSNKLFALYLEKLVALNPKNEFLRLYLAFYYGKKLKAYGMAVKELVALEKSSSMRIRFNALLLKSEVQETIRKEYRNENNKLDLMAYHLHKEIYTRIRDDIMKQTDMQIAVNQEILTTNSDLLKIFKICQAVEKLRKSIHKRMKISSDSFPAYYYEPYLVFGYYEMALNHSIRDFVRYNKIAINSYKKFQPKYKSKRLQQENLYEVNKMLFKIDIKKDSPNIVECTASVKAYLGWEPKFLEDKGIANVIAPPLQNYYLSGIKSYVENGDKSILNNITRTFAFHKNHFIIPVEAYLNIHPILTKGMFLEILMRPIMDGKEYVLVDREGLIEGFTERIGRRLKLKRNQTSINLMSPELAEMNAIYNKIINVGLMRGTRTESEYGTDKALGFSEVELNRLSLFKETTTERVRKSARRHLNLKAHLNEEVSELFHIYSQEGKRMKLAPVKEIDGGDGEISKIKSLTPASDGYTYICKLDGQYYEDFHLKLFVFEESLENQFQDIQSPLLKHAKTIPEKLDSQEVSSTNSLSDVAKYEQEGEENDGTLPTRIAFQTQATSVLYKTKEDKDFPLLTNPKDTENPLFSPKYTENGLMSPKDTMPDGLLSPKCFSNDGLPLVHLPSQADDDLESLRVPGNEINYEDKERYISSLQFHEKTESHLRPGDEKAEAMKEIHEKQENFKHLIAVAESVGSQKSKTSSQERALRPFRQALNTKFKPKSYILLISLFYILLTGIVVDQFVLQLIFENKIDNFKARKDILRTSEQRNNLIIKIQRNMRYIWDISQGRISTAGFLPLALPLPARVTTTQNDLSFLANLNEDLLVNTDILTKEDRQKLFENNVNVFDIGYSSDAGTSPPPPPPSGGGPPPDAGNSVKLTGFQAIDRIVETGLKGIQLYRANQPQMVFERFNFVFQNGLNDFYLKSEDISSLFLQSSYDDRHNSTTMFTFNLVVVMAVLAFVTLLIFMLVYKQYSSEKQNMTAFVKIERAGIEKVLMKLEEFKRLLYQDINYDILEKVKPQEFARGFSRLNSSSKKHSKKEKDYNTSYHGGITWKYFFYAVQYLVIAAIVAALIVLMTLQNISQVSYYYNNLHRIFYLDKTRSNLNLAATISNELLSQNGSTFVRNQSVEAQMIYQIEILKSIILDTPETLKNRKGEYSPLIYTILFEDTCGLFNTSYQAICRIAGQGWKTRSFLNMLRSTESSMSLIWDNYKSSDKSSTVINSLINVAFNQIVIPYSVTGELGSMIETQLNDEFDLEIQNMKNKLVGIMVGIWIIFVFAVVIIWYLVIRKVLLADQEFKRCLKIMPPKLIFANFLLKSYMLKTSNGALNTIRNSI